MKIFITRAIPDRGVNLLKEKGYEVVVGPQDRVLSKEEFITALQKDRYDAVLCLLTDTIDAEIFDAAPHAKIFANYAVGFNNIDVAEAKRRGVVITNTPDVLTDTVAEHTFALILAITSRIAEGDRFVRAGKYDGWAPMMLLGSDLKGRTLGILGAGRIGSRLAHHACRGFDMKVVYYDVRRNEGFEKEYGALYCDSPEAVLKEADVVSIHVPLIDATRHLINAERLAMMKRDAYLINSSRGPVVDEKALVDALKKGVIRGAALDVFEDEPATAPGLAELENVVLTPHIASASFETRSKMGDVAAQNIIAVLEGREAPNAVRG